jgi:hypothetical protein
VVASIVHPHAVIVVGHELARAGDAIIAIVNIAVARIAIAHDLQGERSERAAGGYPAGADCALNDADFVLRHPERSERVPDRIFVSRRFRIAPYLSP